jgi:hypothetical protein
VTMQAILETPEIAGTGVKTSLPTLRQAIRKQDVTAGG